MGIAKVIAPATTTTTTTVPVTVYAHSTSTKYGGQLTIPTGVTYKPGNVSYINAKACNATSWAMVQAVLATAPCTMGTLRNILQQAYGHQCFIGYNVKRGKLAKVAYHKGLVQITQAQVNTIYKQFGITKPYVNKAA